MVKIRMSRYGKHKDPIYRIVAVDSRRKRDGSYLSLLGTLNKNINQKIKLNKEEILKYLKNGAQPSETVKNILKAEGV
jgi:small subunit ribosomal protein S16